MTASAMAADANPYVTPDAGTVVDGELETTITTSLVTVDSNGTLINAEAYNGTIPGPTFHLSVGDTVIVRLVNDLPYPTGIHWHGIELHNSADGTPVTQNGLAGSPAQTLGNGVETGGTYLYRFTVTRPGIFWYHPHHFHSTNRVFRGLYGLIIVTDPDETSLVTDGILPSDTVPLVLSDITVCQAPGSNPNATYVNPLTLPADDRSEWLSPQTSQSGPTPLSLCEMAPAGEAMTEDGSPAAADYGAGDVPNIQRAVPGRTVEGQTVLTNGVNAGGRLGTPTDDGTDPGPGDLAAGAFLYGVEAGQGLRLQIVNCAHLRYFRLILTTEDGVQVPLIRVGGEGGVIDNAVQEGGVIGSFDTGYFSGEILLPTATRADIVAAIPPGLGVGSTLTLWTRDYQRTGGNNPGNWAQLPTVPVMHLEVTGSTTTYNLAAGDALRARADFPGTVVEPLPAPTGSLQNPATFTVGAKTGTNEHPIALLATGGAVGINGPGGVLVSGDFSTTSPYTAQPRVDSSRYARLGDILDLDILNDSGAHHPFHLHGFSFQPLTVGPQGAAPGAPEIFEWPYNEFRDTVDIPSGQVLRLRVRIEENRSLADGVAVDGSLGRWLFHCHIFFHAHQGMIGELIVTDADGSGGERPYVDVGGSWAYAPENGIATRSGTYVHPDGDAISLTATLDNGNNYGAFTNIAGGQWDWQVDTLAEPPPSPFEYVYITGTDVAGRKDQAVFRLQVGGPDQGSDMGDPHLHTVDGRRYDFQAVGEFILLRDRDGLEVQTRQTPVLTANPITDSYSGLTACVSLNTAVAARVGRHRIAYQPGQEAGQLQFFIDGRPAQLSSQGTNLSGHHVSAYDADGATGLRVDYRHGPVLMVTPRFWNSHSVWYLNVSVFHTHADEGLIGPIPNPRLNWLPRLASGASLGPRPKQLHDRYVMLYQVFADSWRVTDRSSLFFYAKGTSTDTFTDKGWPAEQPPCELKPGFGQPGAPLPVGMSLENAQQACQLVMDSDLNADCVFDMATIGDDTFAKGYVFAQQLRRRSVSVQVASTSSCAGHGSVPGITATVLPLHSSSAVPAGYVTFVVDGETVGAPVPLDSKGRACLPFRKLAPGTHQFQAIYNDDSDNHRACSSPTLTHAVTNRPGTGCKWCLTPRWVVILIALLLIVSLLCMLY